MRKYFHSCSRWSVLLAVALLGCGCAARADAPLILTPGLTERGQKPATWEIDANAADAPQVAAGLSQRLYGTGEPDGLHAPLVINAKDQKIFGLSVAAVSRNGATLEMRLNGRSAWTKTWDKAGETIDVNTTYYFALPAGQSKIAWEVTDARGVVVLDKIVLAQSAAQLVGKTEKIELAETNAVTPNEKTRRADGFHGIWFELGQKSKYGDKYSGGLGTYTSSHQPMAVYAPTADKTFFVWGGTTSFAERHLLDMIAFYDHKTGLVSRPVVVYDKNGVDDPHDNPSLNIDKNGFIWVMVSGRNTKRPGLKFRSLKPYSIDGFEQVSEEIFTYPQLWLMPDGQLFHLFTKYTAGRELYFETSEEGLENGRKWSEDKKLAGFSGHYQTSGNWKGKVGTFFNYHPGGDVNKRTNLYYAQTTDGGVTWTTAGGKALTLPLDKVDNAALVIDYAARGELVYTCDLGWDKNGHPLLLYVTSRDGLPGPQGNPRQFVLSRFDGTAWQTTPIAPTDHNYDMGSLYVDGDKWTIIAPTQPGPQPGQAGGEMALWTSVDSGQTWTMTRQITKGSPRNHDYARRPVDARDPFWTFWADGDPTQMSQSQLYFCDSTGQKVFRLPTQIDGDFAAPIAVKIQ